MSYESNIHPDRDRKLDPKYDPAKKSIKPTATELRFAGSRDSHLGDGF